MKKLKRAVVAGGLFGGTLLTGSIIGYNTLDLPHAPDQTDDPTRGLRDETAQDRADAKKLKEDQAWYWQQQEDAAKKTADSLKSEKRKQWTAEIKAIGPDTTKLNEAIATVEQQNARLREQIESKQHAGQSGGVSGSVPSKILKEKRRTLLEQYAERDSLTNELNKGRGL